MPTLNLPDPRQVARAEADRILANPHQLLRGPLELVLADAPWCDPKLLIQGLDEFHAQRMAKVPPPAKYPEARPWVEQALAVDAHLKAMANLTEHQLAVYRSLHDFLMFRGYRQAKPRAITTEKCRIAYLPETDQGPLHIKNVDDPATFWKGEPLPKTFFFDDAPLMIDGVGSGLHIDDEPEEIFPLFPWVMVHHYAADVPAAVEFLTRYCRFFGGGNQVVRDRQKRSVAIEKCGRATIDVYQPDAYGRSHCSGMSCRDPQSPVGRHQRAKRDEYCKLYGLKEDGTDRTFWRACDLAGKKLAAGLDALGPKATVEKVFKLFTTPWPEGLNKDALKVHPDQSTPEYTLVTRAGLIDKRKYFHWQRRVGDMKYPEQPEVVQF